jgi:hypothetical protein
MDKFYKYLKRIGIALSILLNVLLGGYINQTFSARNYGWHLKNKPNLVMVLDFVFDKVFNDRSHCMKAWSYWLTRRKLICD